MTAPFDVTDAPTPTLVALGDLHGWDRNPRAIDETRFEQLKRAMETDPAMLWERPVVAQADGTVMRGNMRLRAAVELGWDVIPTLYSTAEAEVAALRALRDNQQYGSWVEEDLILFLRELGEQGVDLDLAGFDPGELERMLEGAVFDAPPERPAAPSFTDRFVIPPFSILDQRAGYWQERRREWLSLGIRSEIGRGSNLLGMSDTVLREMERRGDSRWVALSSDMRKGGVLIESPSGRDPRFYEQKREVEQQLGEELTTEAFIRDHYQPPDGVGGVSSIGTSVFDPVLCEIAVRWFSPPGGSVLDPFAGGSVRGVVAARLGRAYTGVDLSAEQVAANEEQASEILYADHPVPRWLVGDAADVVPTLSDQFDLVFTCPPYYDLEVYSDDPRDLSSMTTKQFEAAYRRILAAAVEKLRDDSFLVIVVSDVRDDKGLYRPLPDVTTAILAKAGAALYNSAILVNPLGSLPIRAARIFTSTRKLGRTHQNVLVYVKGDPRRASERCGDVEVTVEEVIADATADDLADAPPRDPA